MPVSDCQGDMRDANSNRQPRTSFGAAPIPDLLSRQERTRPPGEKTAFANVRVPAGLGAR